jgi:hypothetical protein
MILLGTPKSTLSSLATVGVAVALLPLGCDGKDSKSNSQSAKGGGTTILTAGTDSGSGGTTTTTDTNGAGTTNSSGGTTTTTTTTTVPDIACATDLECKSQGLLCNKTTQKCVQCVENVDCGQGKSCVAGICGAPGCQSNSDCATSASGKVCNIVTGQCVACMTAADCPNPTTSECIAQACVAVATCVNSLDCTGAGAPVCNRTTSRCVECVDPADCSASGATNPICAASRCQSGCTKNEDCGTGKTCKTTTTPAYCVECLTSADCTGGKICSAGACIVNNCVGTTGKPCTALPPFSGTQTVDANGDEFCYVPAFVLAFDSTAGKINPATGEAATATYPERATFRIGWSATSVHAYIEVKDPDVNPNANAWEIWNGDGVEFMISTSREVTGLTSADANTLHVIANSKIGVTVKASGNSGAHTEITDPTAFKAVATATGYVVEVKLPWPSNATMASGTQVYFDAAINSARKNTDGGAPRVAQALLFQGTTPASTSCTGTGNDIAPFCDDRLWCPTQMQ